MSKPKTAREAWEAMDDFQRAAWMVSVYHQHGQQMDETIEWALEQVYRTAVNQASDSSDAHLFFVAACQSARRNPHLLGAWSETFVPGSNSALAILFACGYGGRDVTDYVRRNVPKDAMTGKQLARFIEVSEKLAGAVREFDRLMLEIITPAFEAFIEQSSNSESARKLRDEMRASTPREPDGY